MFFRRANKIIRYTLTLVVFCFIESRAQRWDIGVSVGVATYSYDDLHDYQEYFRSQFPVDETITESFPAYLTYAVDFNLYVKNWVFGMELGHGSTGGRIFYEDYSGKLKADQLLKYNYLSFAPAYVLFRNSNLFVTGGFKTSLIIHTLTIDNTLTLGSQVLKEKQDFRAFNLGIQPNLTVKRNFKRTFIKASAGYEMQTASQPETTDDENLFLAGQNNKPVKLQGNGLRFSVGAGFRL